MKWLVLALVVAAVAAEFAEEELEDDEQDRLFPFLHKMVRGRKRQAPRTTNIMGSYQKVRLSPKTRDAVCMGGEVNKQLARAAKKCTRRTRSRQCTDAKATLCIYRQMGWVSKNMRTVKTNIEKMSSVPAFKRVKGGLAKQVARCARVARRSGKWQGRRVARSCRGRGGRGRRGRRARWQRLRRLRRQAWRRARRARQATRAWRARRAWRRARRARQARRRPRFVLPRIPGIPFFGRSDAPLDKTHGDDRDDLDLTKDLDDGHETQDEEEEDRDDIDDHDELDDDDLDDLAEDRDALEFDDEDEAEDRRSPLRWRRGRRWGGRWRRRGRWGRGRRGRGRRGRRGRGRGRRAAARRRNQVMLGMVVSFNNCLKRTYRRSCDQIINDILTGSGAKCKSEKPNAVKTVPSGLPMKTGKGKSKKTAKGGKSH